MDFFDVKMYENHGWVSIYDDFCKKMENLNGELVILFVSYSWNLPK